MHWFHGQLRVKRNKRLLASLGGLMGPCSKLSDFSITPYLNTVHTYTIDQKIVQFHENARFAVCGQTTPPLLCFPEQYNPAVRMLD